MTKIKIFSLLSPFLIFTLFGCAIKLGPDPIVFTQSSETGDFRIGDITESVTGTWNRYPDAGIKSQFLGALQKQEVLSFFSGGVLAPMVDIQLTSNHEDDGPRLSSLGAVSLVTLGIIPLKYNSEWDVQCKVTIKNEDGAQVASYNFTEKGTYQIWAYPLTMLSLSGAGARGSSDGLTIFVRISESLLDKIMNTLEKDRQTLLSNAGIGGPSVGTLSGMQKNEII